MIVSRLQKYTFLIAFSVIIVSCRRDEKPGWDVGVLAPLVNSSMTIYDLVADSLRKTNDDHTVSIVYNSPLAELNIDSSLKMPDTSNQANIKLNNLTMEPVNVTNTVSLNQLVAMVPDSDILQLAIAMGLSVPIPAFGPIVQDSIPFDFGTYFQTMTVTDGIVDINVHNNFPFPFTDVGFTIRNQNNDSIIFQQVIPLIPANDSVTVSGHIGNKTVESNLYATTTVSSPGSAAAVKLDPNWNISSTISLHDVVIYSAIAKFPPQMVIYNADENAYDLNGLEFHKILFKQGRIRIEIYNTIPSPLHYVYTIQSISTGSGYFKLEGTVPAASGGTAYHSTDERDMTGYELDLRGIAPFERAQGKDLNGNGHIDEDTINTFYSEVSADITQTTPLIPLSLNDSIYIRGEFIDMVPLYGEGFLGNDTLLADETVDFENFLTKISIGRLQLDSVNLSLVVKNHIGAEGGILVQQISAVNTQSGKKADLTGYPVGSIVSINKPAKPLSMYDTVVPAVTFIELKTGTCNIEKLLEIIPDQFICKVSAIINQGKTPPVPATGTDFIYYGKGINADIAVSVPLSFIAEQIQLRDTVKIDVAQLNTSKLSDNQFQVVAENGFPLNAVMQLYIADSLNNVIDSLMPVAGSVSAGIIDPVAGRVLLPEKSIIKLDLSNEKIEKMKTNNVLIIRASFNTRPDNTNVKIFDDYKLTVKLVGNFKYRVN